MNRDRLKQAIKKIIIQEITNNQLGTPIHTQKKDIDAEKKLKTAMGKDAFVHDVEGTGKTSGRTENQEVQLSKNADNNYDVVSVTHDTERKIARGVSLDAAIELVKKHAADSETTYVQRSWEKGKAPLKKKENEDVQEVSSKTDKDDEMDETSEDTQIDISDKDTQNADVKADKELAPINKDISAPLGGNIVDKIEKIVDRLMKDKAEPKSAYLKHNKDVESPNKLSVKLKDTPALKEKKS